MLFFNSLSRWGGKKAHVKTLSSLKFLFSLSDVRNMYMNRLERED